VGALVPLLVPYGIALIAYAIGHLVGWLHHKHVAAKKGS
jgi:hypothetical protein